MDAQRTNAETSPTSFQERFRASLIKTTESISEGILTLVMFSFMGGLLVLLFEILIWLKQGTYPSFVVLDAIEHLLPNSFVAWISYPTDWIGLSKTLGYFFRLPLPLFLICILPLCLLYCAEKVGGIKWKEPVERG